MAPEKWLPAPKAAGRKVVCKWKVEICSVKKIMAAEEYWPVKPGGNVVASGRLRLPV